MGGYLCNEIQVVRKLFWVTGLDLPTLPLLYMVPLPDTMVGGIIPIESIIPTVRASFLL